MTVGIFTTADFTQDLAAKSFASMITRLMPNGNAPLFALTSMLTDETALQVEHGFFSKTMIFPEVQLAAAVADGVATTFTVEDTTNILPGMIMRVEETGENVIVNTVPDATSITVTRSVGTVAAAAISDTEFLYQVGNAFEEASDRPLANNIIPVRVTNLTQIFRNTWSISGSAQATEVIAGDRTDAESRQDCAALHASDIEKALFFGQKSQGTRNGQPFRTMAGLIAMIEDPSFYPPVYGGVVNSFTAGSTTNWSQLLAMLDPVFNQATDPKGSAERVLFVGGSAKLVINEIGRLNGTYYLVDGQTNFGLEFSTLTTPRGKFRIIEHPLFNTNLEWAKMAVGVDLPTFRLAYLAGRKTQNKEFNTKGEIASDNGIDAVGGTLTTELTTVIKNTPANNVIRNLTAAAVG
jgi:hypothetical protein